MKALLSRALLLVLLSGGVPFAGAQKLALADPDQAAEQARQATGGRVLSVTPSSDPAQPGYYVKVLLSDGRVRVMYVSGK